jgi:hypothetical protein
MLAQNCCERIMFTTCFPSTDAYRLLVVYSSLTTKILKAFLCLCILAMLEKSSKTSHNQPYKISTYLLPHLINNPPMLVHKLTYLLSHIYASVELLYLCCLEVDSIVNDSMATCTTYSFPILLICFSNKSTNICAFAVSLEASKESRKKVHAELLARKLIIWRWLVPVHPPT